MSTTGDQTRPQFRHHRRTPFSARAEPRVWLMGSAIVVCLGLILFMVVLIVARGASTFWPGRMHELRLADGSVVLGVPLEEESYTPQNDAEAEQVAAARQAGVPLGAQAWSDDGLPMRRRYFVGNRDLGQETFRWIPLWQVQAVDTPSDAVLIEREEWGAFLGRLEGVAIDRLLPLDADASEGTSVDSDFDDGVIERTQVQTQRGPMLRERTWVARGSGQATARLAAERAEASERWSRRDALNLRVIPGLESKIRSLRWRGKEAAIEHERMLAHGRDALPLWLWLLMLAAGAGAMFAGVRLGRRQTSGSPWWHRLATPACWVCAALLGIAVFLERPGALPEMSGERLAEVEENIESRVAQLREQQNQALEELTRLREQDHLVRVIAVEPTRGRISPISRSEPDEPMLLSQVVRVVEANRIGFFGRLGVYFDRWGEYLSQAPRDGSSAGGVFPVIVGTVTLTLLLTVSVVPLGVIAALYLREYARQGLMTSIIRVAINNLAGVPSIVYGMFGLGFFCYILGGFIDTGPTEPMPLGNWWWLLISAGLLVLTALVAGGLSRRQSVVGRVRRSRWPALVAFAGWAGTAALAGWALSSTPYFHGFFEEKLPEQPTFGGRGILWASLTLALLTLPVVIVATEEAVAAVPGSMREGSFGCGASKWQTIRRIVLPAAMPGIMTGAILAMARGAGEVAPLMLVGAVNLAPALPVSTEAPFLHGDRTFMHLGFHIYTLGFQNPDSEATEPLVWTTTLLLLFIVLMLNLSAIVLRARLRARMRSAAL